MTKNNLIKWTILAGLWGVLLIPFFVATSMFFPFITGKNFAFRIIVEIIFALWLYLAFVDANYRPKFSWISVSVGIFVLIMTIADVFAVNPAKAIWSNFERMDGLVTLVHLLMYLFVFGNMMKSEKMWLWFFRSSLISSMFMMIYVLKEWLGTGASRVSVTLGNPIYVAVFFMFNFFFALILVYKDVIVKSLEDKKPVKTILSNWLTYVYKIAALICLFGIWRTSTRGVILGLLGGLVVTAIVVAIFEKQHKLVRNSFIGLLVGIAILIGGFLVVKDTQFVQNNVTLKRLADISWSNVQGQGQARQYVWPMAIKGWQERPILGWGQDGFNNIFNKYYDVRMYNQEQWFDRAHNTPLDVLIAGGALGLISYLAIFIASIFVVFKKRNHFGVTESGLIIGVLAAYFAQNLFVFDNLISYMFFFVVLAYLYSIDTNDVKGNSKVFSEDIVNYVVVPILIAVFVPMLWYVNMKPIDANKTLIKAMQTLNQSPEKSLEYFKEVFTANTFGSSEAREQIISFTPQIAAAPTLSTEVKQGFVDLAYTQMQEQIKQTPDDARYQFFMGVFLNNMNQYPLALPHLENAVRLSPNKLAMLFELSKGYAYLGQKQKSLEVAKSAYDLVPTFNDAKISYAAALILNDQESKAREILGDTAANENIIRIYMVRASSFIQKGDKQSAILEVQKAIKMVPGFKQQGDSIIKGILDGSVSN